jgi:tripartite motif-containing protein 71
MNRRKRVVSSPKADDPAAQPMLCRPAARERTSVMDTADAGSFGRLLRQYRLAAGLTQEELAERAHLSARGISDLERGARSSPRRDTLLLLADALPLSAEERARFDAVAQAARLVAMASNAAWDRLDESHGVNGEDAAIDSSAIRSRPGPVHPADKRRFRQERGARRLSLLLRRMPPLARAALGAVLALTIAAAIGLVAQRWAHPNGGVSTARVPRGRLAPWGAMYPAHVRSTLRLNNPFRVAVDRAGNMYVTEGNALYSFPPPLPADVLKLSPSGRPVARWGRYGRRPGEFNSPAGLAVDPQGNIYVADYGNNRIQKLSRSGRPLAVWGSYGTKPGQFDLPSGIALDSRGNVYVADSGNNRVQKLSPFGKPLAVWGGECGPRPGQFCSPTDLAVGPSGDIYVADFANYRIQTLSATGRPLAAWSFPSSEFANGPLAISVDARGNVFYATRKRNVVRELSPTGRVLGGWQVGALSVVVTGLAPDATGNIDAISGGRVYRITAGGRSVIALPLATTLVPVRFDHPSVVTADRHGNVYVLTGSSNNYLQKLSPSGRRLIRWGPETFGTARSYDLAGAAVGPSGDIYVSDLFNGQILKLSPAGNVLARWGREGTAPGQFETPYGLAVDGKGNLYVADTGNNRIQELSPTGKPLAQWKWPTTNLGDMPRAVAVDAQGNIYVADTGNGHVEKLSPNGQPLAVWGPSGLGPGRFKNLAGVAVDKWGDVYAVDAQTDQVTELSSAGTVVARWGAPGARSGQLRDPQGVAVDEDGNVYVADTGNNRLQRLSGHGP